MINLIDNQAQTHMLTIPELTKKITSLPVPQCTQYEMNKFDCKFFLPKIFKKQNSQR